MSFPVPAADQVLSLTVTGDAVCTMVTATGEIDSYSAPHLASALESALSGAALRVSVDMAGVTFLDSAGVHVLAAAYRRAAAAKIKLRIVSERRAVRRPLQLTGLWPVLSTDPTAEGSTPAG